MGNACHIAKTTAATLAALLVLSSTVLPSLSYAQSYADHIANYRGDAARLSAISGFAELYLSPNAAMLPVSLENADARAIDCLPTSCLVEKHVFASTIAPAFPGTFEPDLFGTERHPTGLDPAAKPGPPRLLA
ncbi:MAG: hypothetical protein AAGH60_02900 [Pseudomonadota bacterium]